MHEQKLGISNLGVPGVRRLENDSRLHRAVGDKIAVIQTSGTAVENLHALLRSILPLLDSIVEAEFDLLNPVQCSAKDMDPCALKSRYFFPVRGPVRAFIRTLETLHLIP